MESNDTPHHKVKPSRSLKFARNVFLPHQQKAKCHLCVCEEISAIDGQCFEIAGWALLLYWPNTIGTIWFLVLFPARQRPRGFYQDGFFQGLLVAILMVLDTCIFVIKVQASSAHKPLLKNLKLIHQICIRCALKKTVLIKPARSLFGGKEYFFGHPFFIVLN